MFKEIADIVPLDGPLEVTTLITQSKEKINALGCLFRPSKYIRGKIVSIFAFVSSHFVFVVGINNPSKNLIVN